MATLLLQSAGAALGGLLGPVGAMVGRAAGALAGNVIDRALISSFTTIDGTRLSTARISGADEGTAIPRVWGTMRVGGTLIWATRFEEEVTTERTGAKATGPKVENYAYFGNFALGICEGPITAIRRVWVDGRELDQTTVEMRIHRGGEGQAPDPLIEAKQGTGRAPAYRGLAYVVFERLPLDPYGNRIPVFQFEVVRSIDALEKRIRAITIIPGATEHGYAPFQVTEEIAEGETRILNRNQLRRETDWEASIDELLAVCPALERVSLVVSWFGTDLRAGHCRILPGVEVEGRDEESTPWSVAGYDRTTAHLISRIKGSPAYGGTPNNESVIAAIRDLKARGLKVYLYPFLMMDVPADNALADPHGGDRQAPYPWRGRITCHPAPPQPESPDTTGAATEEIEAFVGDAQASDFTIADEDVSYVGTDEGYRRLVLHYAHLAEVAGGVDGFLIGSEMRGLTMVRGAGDTFPFVDALVALAGDVRAILRPSTKITYGADWSEYFGYHPQDGTGDVYFNLDPLWASDDIDAVGIDNYMPLADFRDSDFTEDHPDGARLADDEEAMRGAITSGEGYDWYYASMADRRGRIRSPITDGLAGRDWLYRYKDIEGWWRHRHHDRRGSTELAEPSAWTPQMKPIWLTELGCPAIDRGANQPNVFVDPKSSESAFPYFSGGRRADEMQRRFLNAHLKYWASDAAPAGMVDPDHIFLWTWDARAIPAFPENEALYADGANWQLGHWLNNRLGAGTLSSVVSAILEDFGIVDHDVSVLSGDLRGLVAADQASARDLIEPLASAFRIDAIERAGTLCLQSRGLRSAPARELDVLAETDAPRWQEVIAQDSDFATEAILDYAAENEEYMVRTARSRRHLAGPDRVLRLALPATLSESAAFETAEAMLRDHRLGRRQLHFALGPDALSIEPGDVIRLADGPDGRFVVSRIEDGEIRHIEARETGSGDVSGDIGTGRKRRAGRDPAGAFAPLWTLMDLPMLGDGAAEDQARIAVHVDPWKPAALSVSPETEGFETRATVLRPATMGRLSTPLVAGFASRFDHSAPIEIEMVRGALSSASDLAVLNGANRLAIQSSGGAWEIVAFGTAEEVAPGRFRLMRLLRGLSGTEDAMVAGAVAGSLVVLLDQAVIPIGLRSSESGLALNWLVEGHGDPVARSGPRTFVGGLRARTPLAPARLSVQRQDGGDLLLNWIRRGRLAADNWTSAEIPLDEAEEAYRVDLLSGEETVRTWSVAEPACLYPLADQIADFGEVPSALTIRVRQLGGEVPLGIAATATLFP